MIPMMAFARLLLPLTKLSEMASYIDFTWLIFFSNPPLQRSKFQRLVRGLWLLLLVVQVQARVLLHSHLDPCWSAFAYQKRPASVPDPFSSFTYTSHLPFIRG